MTKQEFRTIWKSKFPETYPIWEKLRLAYATRWFRIHSLPGSKRYAETDDEYQIIFQRQNEIIRDLIGENEEIILSFGLYSDDLTNSNYVEVTELDGFKKVDSLEFDRIGSEGNKSELNIDIYAKRTNWKSHQYDEILKAIADDKIRMMIIAANKPRIIRPYDGGVDLIVETKEMRDHYKEKYKGWLSKRPDGL